MESELMVCWVLRVIHFVYGSVCAHVCDVCVCARPGFRRGEFSWACDEGTLEPLVYY
jgi:hypothetical protein